MSSEYSCDILFSIVLKAFYAVARTHGPNFAQNLPVVHDPSNGDIVNSQASGIKRKSITVMRNSPFFAAVAQTTKFEGKFSFNAPSYYHCY